MKTKIFFSIPLILVWLFFATLFYKTIVLMILFAIWKSYIVAHMPMPVRKYSAKIIWAGLIICLWVGMPRYRIHNNDRVKLVYLDNEGNAKRPPLTHYVLNTLLPEAEIVNFTTKGLKFIKPIAQYMGIGNGMMNQAQDDFDKGRRKNFLEPYHNLGLDNPISGVYPQLFNATLGTDSRTVYIIEPKHYDEDKSYPLVVFCHGYLGNWQLYQGIWKSLNNCLVLSIGTRGLDGIFSVNDIDQIFTYYLPTLKRMGYHIDPQQIHLMGLSNGGTAIHAAMNSALAKDFKSLTTISCNLSNIRRVPCQVNLIGGGADNSAKLMPGQYRALKQNGVDTNIFFVEDENHFILVNRRAEILDFIQEKILKDASEKDD